MAAAVSKMLETQADSSITGTGSAAQAARRTRSFIRLCFFLSSVRPNEPGFTNFGEMSLSTHKQRWPQAGEQSATGVTQGPYQLEFFIVLLRQEPAFNLSSPNNSSQPSPSQTFAVSCHSARESEPEPSCLRVRVRLGLSCAVTVLPKPPRGLGEKTVEVTAILDFD